MATVHLILRKSRWILFLVLLVTGLALLPVLAYVAGGRVAGPYAGPRGLASYLGAIYTDAAHGRPLALLLLTGPLLAIYVWPLRAWLLRRLANEAQTSSDPGVD